MADLQDYLNLIPSPNNQRPKFMALIAVLLQWSVDFQNQMAQLPALFDVDLAVGDQQDKIGRRVGANRNLAKAVNGVTVLDDATFRILTKLVIAMNAWDGTVPGAYAVWNTVFAAQGIGLLMQDYQDTTLAVVFTFATVPTDLVLAVLTNGYFNLKPASFRIIGYYQPSLPNTPMFGLGVENATIAGLGVGALVEMITE